MKTVIDYLNDLYNKVGSDYKCAQKLEINRASINQIRQRGTMADETAVKLAEVLEIDKEQVLIAAAIARSSGNVRELWVKISERAGLAAGIAVMTPTLARFLEIANCILC